jgi:hypothetical protein
MAAGRATAAPTEARRLLEAVPAEDSTSGLSTTLIVLALPLFALFGGAAFYYGRRSRP